MSFTSTRRLLSGAVGALALTLTLTGLSISQATTASASAPSLSASPAQPLVGATVALRGAVKPAGRVVSLQKWSGGRWVGMGSKRAARNGTYSFSVRATSAATSYQVVAAATKVKRKRYQAAASRKAVVGGVSFTSPAKRLTFSEDFDTLDPARWSTRAPGLYHGNRKCAAPSASMARASGGVLTLGVARTSLLSAPQMDGSTYRCDGAGGRPKYVYQNAMIGTAEGNGSPFTQAYGTFAAQIKMQDATGMHGAFWLQGNDPTSDEIDVVEHFGTGHASALTTKIHPHPARGLASVSTGNLAGRLAAQGRRATDWNVYSVDWSPSAYIFRINGRETFRTVRTTSSAQQEIVLSLLTSDWARGSLKDPGSKMYVDWVRAWAY